MDKTTGEASEKQQLVATDEDEEGRQGASLSPAASGVLSSSGAASYGSKTNPIKNVNANTTLFGNTRVAYVSERRPTRPPRHTGTTPTSGMGIKGGDSRRTQAALLRLLANFHATPPSSDTPGSLPPALLHMEDIREQQDNLARLHFKLGSDPDAPAKPASARETMVKLVKSLEQLSTSIEQLHSTTDFYNNTVESLDEGDTQIPNK